MPDPVTYRYTREEVIEWARERLADDGPSPRRDFDEGRASAFVGIIDVLTREASPCSDCGASPGAELHNNGCSIGATPEDMADFEDSVA